LILFCFVVLEIESRALRMGGKCSIFELPPQPDFVILNIQKKSVRVAHTCNPYYSGGRDQEDISSKPARGKQFVTPYLENTQHKKGLVECLK
jgi:hypothetical protein